MPSLSAVLIAGTPWSLKERFMTTLSRSPSDMMDECVRSINYTMSSASAGFLFAAWPWRLLVGLRASAYGLGMRGHGHLAFRPPRFKENEIHGCWRAYSPVSLSLIHLMWNLFFMPMALLRNPLCSSWRQLKTGQVLWSAPKVVFFVVVVVVIWIDGGLLCVFPEKIRHV